MARKTTSSVTEASVPYARRAARAATARKPQACAQPGKHHQAWQTPSYIFDGVEDAVGPIALDPCSPGAGKSSIRALVHYVEEPGHPEGGGLAAEWSGASVWMNPPYADPGPWCAKALASVRSGAVGIVVALLPVRTDAGWYRDSIARVAHLLLLPKRVRFDVAPGVPGAYVANFPCMLVVWGGSEEQIAALLDAFQEADFRPAADWRAPQPRAKGTARSRTAVHATGACRHHSRLGR